MNEPQSRPAYALLLGPDGLRPGWGLLLFTFLYYAALTLVSTLVSPMHPSLQRAGELSPSFLFLSEGKAVFAVALATWIMSRVERRPATPYGLGGTRKLPYLLAGLGWGVAFLSILVFALKLTGLLVFDRRLLFGGAAVRYGMVWLGGFLLVALLEETLLRGYLQYTLARGLTGIYRALDARHSSTLGFWTAAFLLSLLFGLGHSSNPGESPIGLFAAALAGLVFCLALWRTGSLWWAIGFHTSWDWAQSFLYGVADSGTMVQFHLFRTQPVGRPVFSGGATGPEGSLLILPVLGLVVLVILNTTGNRFSRSSSTHTGSPPSPVPAPASASPRR